jgi:hypothetical protein
MLGECCLGARGRAARWRKQSMCSSGSARGEAARMPNGSFIEKLRDRWPARSQLRRSAADDTSVSFAKKCRRHGRSARCWSFVMGDRRRHGCPVVGGAELHGTMRIGRGKLCRGLVGAKWELDRTAEAMWREHGDRQGWGQAWRCAGGRGEDLEEVRVGRWKVTRTAT